MKYADLPETPARPHGYFVLESLDVAVKLPKRDVPIRIHCKLLGNGPPLLLIHGLMTSSYSFRYIIPALAGRYQVIVPDLPGAGRSEAPIDLSMSPHSVATLLCSLIATLQIEPPYVVGNSLGGYLALWFAVLFPDRLRKLIVMHAPGFPQLPIAALRFLLASGSGRALVRRVIGKDPEGFVARNLHYHDKSIMSREEAQEYAAIFYDRDRTEVFFRIFRESLDPRLMRELAERLSAIKGAKQALVPIRLLWARQDVLVPPSFGPRYQALLSTAELVWFDQASHFLQVDDPGRTAQEILQFDE